jgi:hypothetical protein
VSSWLGSALGSQPQITDTGLRIQTALAGQPIPKGWGENRIAGNLIWYGDFNSVGGSGSGKGSIGAALFGPSTPTYYASSIIAFCEGQVYEVVGVFNSSGYTSTGGKGSKSTTVLPNSVGEIPLASMGYTLFDGSTTQEPWGYMTSAHPTQALAYRGICYICQANQNLGSSAELPMINLDIVFSCGSANEFSYSNPNGGPAGNINPISNSDWNPADIVIDFLTNPYNGLPGWPAGIIGDVGTSRTIGLGSGPTYNTLSTFWNFCQAAGLWVSPVLTSSQTASDFLSDLLKFASSEAFFSQGQLKIIPYWDQESVANGGYYYPPTQQIYDIFDDDLIVTQHDPEGNLEIDTVDVTTQLNDIRVTYLDRNNQYNPAMPMEAKDDAAIALYGLRPNQPEQWDFLCLANAAAVSSQVMLQRQKVVTTFKFTVDQSFILLDPMDIVALYLPQLGIVGDGTDGQWVRIKEIQENADFSLAITAEIYLAGTGSAPLYGPQPLQGATPQFGVLPGNVNPPLVFEPTLQLSDAMEVWVAVSGSSPSAWGGCQVWISTDNVTYAQVPGTVFGAARMGTLAAVLPVEAGGGNTIDTTHVLSVNLSESGALLSSGTQSDAQALATLCMVSTTASSSLTNYAGQTNIEFLAYESASEFAANEFNLSYLVRGAYGTSAVMNSDQHAAGANFARLDKQIFQIPYNQNQIGQTIYIKFLSFNIVGAQLQTLAEVEPYTYTIQGLAAGITTLENFAAIGIVAQGANGQQIPAIQVTWTPIENAAVTSVVIEYYLQGGSASQATQVTSNNPAAGILIILAGIQPGTTYEVLGTITTAPDNLLPSTWAGPIAVTTPNVNSVVSNNPPGVPTGLTLANVVISGHDYVAAGWTAVTSVNVASYVLQYSINGGTPTTITGIAVTTYQIGPLTAGETVLVQVASVSNLGAQSAFSAAASITVTGTASTPNAPSDLVVTPGLHEVLLSWVNPANPDLAFIQVWMATTDQLSSATNVLDVDAPASSAVVPNLTSGDTYYFWINAVNTSGIDSLYNSPANSGTAATTIQINGGTDIVPASIVNAAMATNSITTTNILPGSIETPQLAAGAVTAANIEAGTITSAQIAADTITGGNIAAGTIVADNIGAEQITAAAMAANSITAANAALAAESVGTANIQNLAVNTLQIAGQAITVPVFATGGAFTGNGAFQTVLSASITVNSAVNGEYVSIACICILNQQASASAAWEVQIVLEGTVLATTVSTNVAQPTVTISAGYTLTGDGSPQTLTFDLNWLGVDPFIGVESTNMLLIAAQR